MTNSRRLQTVSGVWATLNSHYGKREHTSIVTQYIQRVLVPGRGTVTLYEDCFDAKDKGGKVFVVWGDGSPTQEFLSVRDAAEAIVLAAERYDKSDPAYIGSGFEISIKNLVNKIIELTEYNGNVTWDTTKANGQPRRYLDTTKAEREFGFKVKIDLNEGLRRTIDWYWKKVRGIVA